MGGGADWEAGLTSIGGGTDWVGLVSIRCGHKRTGRVGLVGGLKIVLAFSTAGTSSGTELRGSVK